MDNLLFLAHRIPYPPNKGDKIRSFHFLKYLSRHFNVFLGAFIDDVSDVVYEENVKELCSGIKLININPKVRTFMSAKGLLAGKPLSLPYYDVSSMHDWVSETVNKHQISKAFVFSSVMSQFVMHYQDMSVVADFVDIDSDKWRQYAEKKRWPMSWVYKRESNRLFDHEKKVTLWADKVLFVSQKEANLYKTLVSENSSVVDFVNNGVDIEYFQPRDEFINPYQADKKVVLFTGAMDYWANADAVIWLVNNVLPKLREIDDHIVFYIVGSNPSTTVEALQEHKDVVVTGRVEDMRPYLQFADVVAAPLHIARGIQNKVLEAMAMGKPVIATTYAMEGIDAVTKGVAVIDDADGFARELIQAMKIESFVLENREFVEQHFSWKESVGKLVSFFQ
jgi:sugar transferase (PEP-CTERM/EpsH1 system associated)